MRKLREIASFLEELYPLSCQESWDNSGLQVGSFEQQISGIVVSLDLSAEVVKEAQDSGANLILTHHPLLFKPLKKIDFSSYIGKLIRELVLEDISLYAVHTSFDNAIGGLNDILVGLLGFSSDIPIVRASDPVCRGAGRVVELQKPVLAEEFVSKVSQGLGVGSISLAGDFRRNIRRFAVCGGSGAEFLYRCLELGIELYITADIKYHDAQFAVSNGISLIILNHFEMERAALPVLAEKLSSRFKDLKVHLSNIYLNPIYSI